MFYVEQSRLVCDSEVGEVVSRLLKFPSLFVANSGGSSLNPGLARGELTDALLFSSFPPRPAPSTPTLHHHDNIGTLSVIKNINSNYERVVQRENTFFSG